MVLGAEAAPGPGRGCRLHGGNEKPGHDVPLSAAKGGGSFRPARSRYSDHVRMAATMLVARQPTISFAALRRASGVRCWPIGLTAMTGFP